MPKHYIASRWTPWCEELSTTYHGIQDSSNYYSIHHMYGAILMTKIMLFSSLYRVYYAQYGGYMHVLRLMFTNVSTCSDTGTEKGQNSQRKYRQIPPPPPQKKDTRPRSCTVQYSTIMVLFCLHDYCRVNRIEEKTIWVGKFAHSIGKRSLYQVSSLWKCSIYSWIV